MHKQLIVWSGTNKKWLHPRKEIATMIKIKKYKGLAKKITGIKKPQIHRLI